MIDTIVSDGVYPSDYVERQIRVPPTAYDDLFTLRFTAYGTTRTSSRDWYVDDVAITPVYVPADLDQDWDVDVADFIAFQTCFNGPDALPACT